MTKILPETLQDGRKQSTLIFVIDKTDTNEKYQIEAYKRNRSQSTIQQWQNDMFLDFDDSWLLLDTV